MSQAREEIGYAHAPARKPRAAPKSDRDVVEAHSAYEGIERVEDPRFPWQVTLCRKNETRVWLCGATEDAAFTMARSFIDIGGLDE